MNNNTKIKKRLQCAHKVSPINILKKSIKTYKTTRLYYGGIELEKIKIFYTRFIIYFIIQAVVKWFKFTVWDTITATTDRSGSGVRRTLRRVGTMSRGTWSRGKVSLGLLLERTVPQPLSEAAVSGCQQIDYNTHMNRCQREGMSFLRLPTTASFISNIFVLDARVCVCF